MAVMHLKIKSSKQRKNIHSPRHAKGKEITRELTVEEEKAAFLYTNKVNAARIFAKQLGKS
jgi:hypothetical protein